MVLEDELKAMETKEDDDDNDSSFSESDGDGNETAPRKVINLSIVEYSLINFPFENRIPLWIMPYYYRNDFVKLCRNSQI